MENKCFLVVPQMIDMWMKKEYVSREILGVEYLGAALKKANINCTVLNAYAQRISNDEVCKIIMKENYKIVGVSCPSQRSYPFSKDLVKKLRNEYNYKGFITMGGFYVSLAYKEILEDCKEIDYLMRGEGERTIAPFYNALFTGKSINGIKGITYLKDGSIITETPDYIEELDELPFPIRDMDNFKQFKDQDKIPFRVMSGRGCYGRCTFCSVIEHERPRCKLFRSAKNIVDEIEDLVKTYNAKIINFADDIFFDGSKRSNEHINEFVRLMKERNIHIEFDCHLRATDVNEEQLMKLKSVGLTTVWLGLESGCQRLLDEMHKNCTVEQNYKAIEILKKCKLTPSVTFITLVPTMSFEELKMNYSFLKKIDCYCEDNLYNRLNIYTGCEYEKILEEKGLLTEKKRFYDRDNYIFADEKVGFYANIISIMKELFIKPRKILYGINCENDESIELDQLMDNYTDWSKKTWEFFVDFCMENIEKENMDMEFYNKMMKEKIEELANKVIKFANNNNLKIKKEIGEE